RAGHELQRTAGDIEITRHPLADGSDPVAQDTAAEQVFTPSNVDTILVAQGPSPAGAAAWTVVTAPSAKDLREGLEVMTAQLNWPQISGHITTYS
ncbi:hypothetical protein, partial [Rhizobium johnstonii]|uniref:hypothetical protein n=1 Tax=Rhizobium johnstonii TaxID=3019933 RepID=UPI003F95E99C